GRRGLPGVRSESTKAALLSYHPLYSIRLVFCLTPIAAYPILVHKISKKEKSAFSMTYKNTDKSNAYPLSGR
ncbi:hypothetical protein NL511_31900, partial [Klebsiella pneumoniae]|nr:hypothetical protein [Klebsiella pneumoniae]